MRTLRPVGLLADESYTAMVGWMDPSATRGRSRPTVLPPNSCRANSVCAGSAPGRP